MRTIKASNATAPTDVAAEEDAENPGTITVTWTAPENATEEVTEDFASYENGADEDGELGEWTLVNANGHTKGGIFSDLALASDGQVRAWQVFNITTYGGDNDAFAGPDGNVDNNQLYSIYNLENNAYPGNDDWLISPSLPGTAQTVSFDVKAFNDYGAQTYQVLYSTTDKNIESFELIEEVTDNGGAWSNVSYNLPEGTKYFAIRNITGGDEGFILAVDNIVYLVGGGEVASYNVYVDGVLVATVEGGVTTYVVDPDSIDASGDHEFSVSARIGREGPSGPMVWDGRGSHGAILGQIPLQHRFEKGDTVYTSGHSLVFPPDIPLGVAGDARVINGATNEIQVRLFQDFTAIRYVTVVHNTAFEEVEEFEQ